MMNFDKIIENMNELKAKIENYEMNNRKIEQTIIAIQKDIQKMEKQIEKEPDEINKKLLQIKIIITKEIIERFNFKN